jgi:hypothetical protein
MQSLFQILMSDIVRFFIIAFHHASWLIQFQVLNIRQRRKSGTGSMPAGTDLWPDPPHHAAMAVTTCTN